MTYSETDLLVCDILDLERDLLATLRDIQSPHPRGPTKDELQIYAYACSEKLSILYGKFKDVTGEEFDTRTQVRKLSR